MSDYETIQRNRNITVGAFVLIALCSLIWLIFKFGDLPVAVSKFRSYEVFVQFATASGVQKDTPVRFCGYQIGRVTSVKPPKILEDRKTGEYYHQTVAVMSIDKKYNDIPANVNIKLMTRGLGSSYIELIVDSATFDPNLSDSRFLVDKVTLQGSTGIASEFFPAESQAKLETLVEGISSLIKNVNDIVGDQQNKENLKKTLANFVTASAKTNEAIEDLQRFFDSGTNTSEELNKAILQMRVIMEKVNSGQGTAAKFVNDGRLYENLIENTQQLEQLLEQLKLFIAKAREQGVPIKLK